MSNEISTHTPINLEEVAVMAKMPANQTYLSLPDDPDCDKDDAKIEVRREGPSVLVYVSEDGGYADVDAGELPELIKALSQAGTDARVFLSAIRKYSLMKRKKLDCQLIGHQTKVEYEFGPYTVAFEVCDRDRVYELSLTENGHRRLLDRSVRPIVSCGMTMADAEKELKVFLIEKANQDEVRV